MIINDGKCHWNVSKYRPIKVSILGHQLRPGLYLGAGTKNHHRYKNIYIDSLPVIGERQRERERERERKRILTWQPTELNSEQKEKDEI